MLDTQSILKHKVPPGSVSRPRVDPSQQEFKNIKKYLKFQQYSILTFSYILFHEECPFLHLKCHLQLQLITLYTEAYRLLPQTPQRLQSVHRTIALYLNCLFD